MAQLEQEIHLPYRLVGRDAARRAGPYVTRAAARYRRIAWLIASTDVVALVVAMASAYVLRFGAQPIPGDFALVMGMAPAVWIGVFSAFRLYSIQHLGPAEEFRRVISAVAVGMTAIMLASFWSRSSFSRAWVGLTLLLSVVLVLAGRKAWHGVLRRMRADGRLAYRTLLVGANGEIERLAREMRAPHHGFRAIGYVATGEDPASAVRIERERGRGGLPVFGHVADIQDVIRETSADCIFVASTAMTPLEMAAVTRAARLEGVEVRVSANLPEILSTRLTLQPFGSVMALSLKPVRLSGQQAAAKRAFDLVLSLGGLLVTFPIWIGITLAIVITSRGPVFYRQERVGRHGRTFTLLKFRTMCRGADEMVVDLSGRNEASGPLFKIRDDPRVTRVGRWLRRWSLDEVPQLINVVKGEMSLVGPRPALPREVLGYEDWQCGRLEVPPGITGLWQVNGRADVKFDEYVRLDLFYIENWSISYDLFILAKTVPALLSKKGAY